MLISFWSPTMNPRCWNLQNKDIFSAAVKGKFLTSVRINETDVVTKTKKRGCASWGVVDFDGLESNPNSWTWLWEIFKGTVDALNGTLVHAVIQSDKQVPCRRRGGRALSKHAYQAWFWHGATFVWAWLEWIIHAWESWQKLCKIRLIISFPPLGKY